jgi:hypothetical protein
MYKIEILEAIMKTRILATIILAVTLGFTSCKHHINDYYDDVAPLAPSNVKVLALDYEVEISWDRSPDGDVSGYNVYSSYEYDGEYTLIGNTRNTYYIDGGNNGPDNGVKYYYAVTAYDYEGNESDLSDTYVYGIPRPEGFNVSLFDYNVDPVRGGFDFSDYKIVDYSDENSDLFFDKYEGKYYLDVWDDSDIKDMGPTSSITAITLAPVSGYVVLIPGDNIKYTEVFEGHTYIIKTWNNHFAKVRIKQIAADRVIFDWAYQLLENERMLKAGKKEARNTTYTGVKVHRQ